ncbi:hypothetical protein H5407_06105 [Mitsuaria sp. WAJ17]|uniref:hypothetical protein n=1 Tax=Mitsuaria sp. WAJ17 TaxID=2761452 RepID=UPI0016045511|nr:hypothetical protein [Mitsuaria sp. WAJ17]MBB2484798.1 hypothetical protein [Mitsuaria sp. WAJ17]
MLKSLFIGLCGLSMAVQCAAQIPAVAPASSALPAGGASAAAPPWIHVEAQATLRVQVRLLPMGFSQGRDTPVYTGYRPQLRFPDHPAGSTCALNIPPGVGGELKPGESAEATVRCLDALQLRDDRRQFQMFQGGRLVGEGQVLP